MQVIYRFATNPILVGFMCFSIFFLSCSQYDHIESPEISSFTYSDLSGEELFRSFVFLDGQATRTVQSLEKIMPESYASTEQMIEYRKSVEETIQFLKTNHQNFFEEFKVGILSKDAFEISETISDAKDKLQPFIVEKLESLDKESLAYIGDLQENGVIIPELELVDSNKSASLAIWFAVSIVLILGLVITVVVGSTETSGYDVSAPDGPPLSLWGDLRGDQIMREISINTGLTF